MNKRILFATDLGLYSPYLMKQLSKVAISMQATVDIIHVIEPMGVFAESIINTYVPNKDRRYLREHGLEEVLSNIKEQVIQTLNNDYTDTLKGRLSMTAQHQYMTLLFKRLVNYHLCRMPKLDNHLP